MSPDANPSPLVMARSDDRVDEGDEGLLDGILGMTRSEPGRRTWLSVAWWRDPSPRTLKGLFCWLEGQRPHLSSTESPHET